jgi:glutamate-1-semialdehyde 2,1-aminomutase
VRSGNQLGVNVSEKLGKMIPCAEMVRFASTGTEAIMHCLMIARGYTGRDKILKMEGGFDGWYDSVMISAHTEIDAAGPERSPTSTIDSAGMPKAAAEHTMVVPYNNEEALATAVKEHRNELAAVIMEPVAFNMGCVVPKESVSGICEKDHGRKRCALDFDFRRGYHWVPFGTERRTRVFQGNP